MSIASRTTDRWLERLTPAQRVLLGTPEGRRAVTKFDYESFIHVYFRRVLSSEDTGNQVSLSEFHHAFVDDAAKYTVVSMTPGSSRTAWVCPRGAGKSASIMMLIIWLAAHHHQKFVALFSATTTQAEEMLANIRAQFTRNEFLIQDYPDLVAPATRRYAQLKLSDNRQLIIQRNGFVCTGRGIDSSVLGMRIENMRPSMLIADDIEGGEELYSAAAAQKRLVTLQDDIFPLSLNAHVMWIGTTTRPMGLTEALVHHALGEETEPWVQQENFKVNYWPALLNNPDGTVRSMWPERWSLEYLEAQRGLRSFNKNFMCLPSPEDYPYWQPSDFVVGSLSAVSKRIMSIDPAVTTKQTSDQTAVAVVSYSHLERKACVDEVFGVRMKGEPLRQRVLEVLSRYPDIQLIKWEKNQGGDALPLSVLHNMPVPIELVHQSIKKELRAEHLLSFYRRKVVIHARLFPEYERQCVAFPGGKHDDLIDAVSQAVDHFAAPAKATRLSAGVR